MSDVIGTRHPRLKRLIETWRANAGVVTPDDLAAMEVMTARLAPIPASAGTGSADAWRIAVADTRLSDLYGQDLVGRPAGALMARTADACPAQLARETGREIVIEETLATGDGPVRIARVYLPLAGTAGQVLCAASPLA